MKYRKTFGWAKPLAWLVGDGDDKTSARETALAEKLKALEGFTIEQLRTHITRLEGDNYGLREKNRELKTTAEKVKDFDAMTTELESYRTYGKPDELKTKLDGLTTTSKELEQYKMGELVASAAKTTRLEFEMNGKKESRAVNPENLAKIIKLHGLKLELKDGTLPDADGKPVVAKIAHVLLEEGKSKPLSEYIGTDLGEFASWVAETPAKPATAGTNVVPQPSGTTPTPTGNTALDVLNSRIGKTTEKFDPLNPNAIKTP
jgi:hypothetical protein